MLRQRPTCACSWWRITDATCIECAEAKIVYNVLRFVNEDATCIECAEAKGENLLDLEEHIDATCIECAEAKGAGAVELPVENRMQPVGL